MDVGRLQHDSDYLSCEVSGDWHVNVMERVGPSHCQSACIGVAHYCIRQLGIWNMYHLYMYK